MIFRLFGIIHHRVMLIYRMFNMIAIAVSPQQSVLIFGPGARNIIPMVSPDSSPDAEGGRVMLNLALMALADPVIFSMLQAQYAAALNGDVHPHAPENQS